jgi:predicted phage terminase large subunit-like protein
VAVELLEIVRAEKARKISEAERTRRHENAERIREKCRSLSGFVEEAWHVVEPGRPYVHGWHIDAIADHLAAVTSGQINRLLINVPPGTMKSLLTSVLWPAWEWTFAPSLQYLTTSYVETYVKRDSRRMRNLVSSEWYQDLWGEKVTLRRLGEMSFDNTANGNREGVVYRSLTGGRGDRVIVDDPHSVDKAESETDRESALRLFREQIPTRLNDATRSAIIVIMQRLHERDISGEILANDWGYTHLMLPMEFEMERRCRTFIGGKPFFIDPRYREGELLFEERFPRAAVERDKKILGSYAVAGQYQQRPAPRGGGLFKREWFGIVHAVPVGTVFVRHWDFAASGRTSARSAATVGLLMGRCPDGSFLIADVKRVWEEGDAVRRLVKQTAELDDMQWGSVLVSLPQDPGQAGKVQAKAMIVDLAGHEVKAQPETGDKETRARPLATQAEAGNVKLLAGPWIPDFLEEASSFPNSATKDQIDAASGAFGRLLDRKTTSTKTKAAKGAH